MKKITIKVPDDISEKEEAVIIAKRLMQKALSGTGRNKEQKLIGKGQVTVKDLQTTIIVERVSTEKPVQLLKCNCCGADYAEDMAKVLWVNYGGKRRALKYCSDECVEKVEEITGPGRSSRKKNGLKPVTFYR